MSEARTEAYEAADELWRDLPTSMRTDDEHMYLMENLPVDPSTVATLARFSIGNVHGPIGSIIATARQLNIHVGQMPFDIQDKVPAFSALFHGTPILLVGETRTMSKFNQVVAVEIGGLLLGRSTATEGIHGRKFDKLRHEFADAFLYPDSAVLELKHMKSPRRFVDHSLYFGVSSSTILRRLRTGPKS